MSLRLKTALAVVAFQKQPHSVSTLREAVGLSKNGAVGMLALFRERGLIEFRYYGDQPPHGGPRPSMYGWKQ